MKYFKKLKIYKASNVTFNPETFEAYSYGWWKFVSKINGKIVFNSHFYSQSTSKHQHKVNSLLGFLGIKIDLYVKTSKSLGNFEAGLSALKQAYWDQDLEKAKLIEETFQISMSQDEISNLYEKKEEFLCNQYLKKALKYQEKKEAEALKKAKELENSADIININFNKGA